MFHSETLQEHILYDKIYQYLWVKSETSNPPSILIPETVILIRSMPIYWYFTDRGSGEVKRKMHKNVNKENIKESWLNSVGKSGVVGYLLHFIENLDLNYPNEKLKVCGQIQIIYFDKEGFIKFMDSNVELPFGILQKYVEAADDKNSQIQALWSKQITLFTKRTTKKSYLNKSMNIYERLCTFEGPDYLSEATQVKDFQSQRISEQIQKMINHLDSISFGKLNISQGIFYFKVDRQAKCWFLFCGNLKFDGEKHLKDCPKDLYQQAQIKIPKSIDGIMSVYSQKPQQLNKESKCIKCGGVEKENNFILIPYHYILEYDQNTIQPQNWPNEIKKGATKIKLVSTSSASTDLLNTISQVPLVLQKVHEKLNYQSFDQYKNHDGFLHKTLQVCLNCYISLVAFQEKKQKDSVVNSISPHMKIKKSLGGFTSAKSLQQYLRPDIKEKIYTQASDTCRKYKNIKIRPVQQYVQQRLQSLSPTQKSSLDFPSSPDLLSYHTKSSTYELGSNNRKLRNCYNQSLQVKLNNLNI
ncbi:unnamed protein product (macronuclear) [Paramecium tetraurelia]|uniref:Uncharacterized protein n=1 Tax=Paramecium tetraurelia TaxID=5888 RepID=A0D187_PARTE|nr:uncharacterized protein GSPATT00012328001 [Paramecium tetraurelia]CAK76804.1 unnamed protein product [Paramecium tetraurelia]|eukprot:XP_001444201.1 hypothetical protein (macronuclear) [Paramecium tetraurelia strain d4-2]